MEYFVIHASGLSELESKVREYICDGWKPQGGLCALGLTFFQAMVRKPRGYR